MSTQYYRSCLRWPGNKFNLIKDISAFTPQVFKNYHEPFLGSATVYLNSDVKNQAFLSDCNVDLINFYLQLKSNIRSLIECLRDKQNTESFYYEERSKKYTCNIEKAAQFYFLNRTCYNGVYRVNSKGVFNVPYGRRESLNIIDDASLFFTKEKLENAHLFVEDFYCSLDKVEKSDFVYLDPPYSGKSNDVFSMYNDKLFYWADQIRLQQYCEVLLSRNVNFILNNLYNEEVFKLFAVDLGLKYVVTERPLLISSKLSSRRSYKEYLFVNSL